MFAAKPDFSTSVLYRSIDASVSLYTEDSTRIITSGFFDSTEAARAGWTEFTMGENENDVMISTRRIALRKLSHEKEDNTRY